MNTAPGAPRLSASIAAAPEPAKRSSIVTVPGVVPLGLDDPEERLLDAVAQGTRAAPGDRRRTPRALPVMTRPASGTDAFLLVAFARGDARAASRSSARPASADHRGSSSPSASRRLVARVADAGREGSMVLGCAARRPAAAAGRSGPGRGRRPRRAAPVQLRQLEAVVRGPQGLETGARHRVRCRVGDEDAVRCCAAAPDPAAQLVQLREAEPVRLEHDHHRRLGHVHAHLDDGRADEHVEVAVAEAAHLGLPVGAAHPPWTSPTRSGESSHAQARRDLLGPSRGRQRAVRRCGQGRAERLAVDVGLPLLVGIDVGHDDERPMPILLPRSGRAPTSRRAHPAGGCRSRRPGGPRGPRAGPRPRGPRRRPAPASAGWVSRSSAGCEASGRARRAPRAAPRRTDAARR